MILTRRCANPIMFVGLMGLLSGGCVSLEPYDEVRALLPPQEFLRIGDQWIHYESFGSGGEPVMFIHGFGGSTYSWWETLSRLGSTRRVVAVDLNGFGYTQRLEAPESYSLAAQRDLILDVMDALEIDRAHVVGHSYGAGVALRLAWDHAERVRSLSLVDGGGGSSGGPSIPAVFKPFLFAWVKNFALREDNIRSILESSVHRKEVITDVMVDEYLKRLRIEGLDSALYGLTSGAGPMLPPIHPELLVPPTLIVWGVYDRVIPIRLGEELALQIPKAQLVRFDASGHSRMEEEPQRFVEVLVEFLDSAP